MSMTLPPWDLVPDGSGQFFAVQGEKGGNYPYSNSMLVLTDIKQNKGILLDAGFGNGVARKLRKQFTITDIYFTHWHEDHVISHRLLSTATNHCHEKDVAPLENLSTFLHYYGVAGTAIEAQFATYMEAIGFSPVEGVEPFRGNQNIDLGQGESLEIIPAPGHTAGHCIFHEPRSRVAFLGDIDLSRFGPWYGTRDSSLTRFMESIDLVAKLDVEHVVTGHSAPISGRQEIQGAIKEYKTKICQRDERLLDLLRNGKELAAGDMVGKGVIYKHMTEFKEYLVIAEGIMIDQHLAKLQSEGKVAKNGDRYSIA